MDEEGCTSEDDDGLGVDDEIRDGRLSAVKEGVFGLEEDEKGPSVAVGDGVFELGEDEKGPSTVDDVKGSDR